MLSFTTRGLAASMVLCVAASAAQADIITENLALPENIAAVHAAGQSVTTPSGGPWNQITFNYYRSVDYDTGDPFATGGLFLLDQEYLGWPGDLSSSTAGYIAESTGTQAEGSGSEWTFASDVTLQADTQYWFYMDGYPGALLGYNQSYAGGDYYESWISYAYQVSTGTSTRFQLEGANQAVPEPTTLAALSGLLGVGLIGRWWRRRKAA